MGVLGVINHSSVNFLDLSQCNQSVGTQTCAVGGTSGAQGPTDSFTSGVSKHAIELGISDLEPTVFGNNLGGHFGGGGLQNPAAVYTFVGASASESALAALPQTRLFQQVFGIIANTSLGISDITSAQMKYILTTGTSDWSAVPNSAGTGGVTGTSTPFTVCQRDLGSGTRAGTDIYFDGTGCNIVSAGAALNDRQTTAHDNYSTLEELACVNTNPNSIGYVSIDNFSSTKIGASGLFTSVKALTVDGIPASNLAAATGQYRFAFEAYANDNTAAQAANSDSTTFYPYLKSALQAVATAPQSSHVNALKGLGGNVASVNVGATKVGSIYVAAYDRGGNSCTYPKAVL